MATLDFFGSLMAAAIQGNDETAGFEVVGDPTGRGSLRLVLFGDWLTRRGVPSAERVHAELKGDAVTSVRLDTARLGAWDTAFLTFLRKLERLTAADGPKLDTSSLPEGATRLLGLAASVPERAGARKAAARPPLLERVGKGTQAFLEACGETLAFIGEVVIAFGRLVRGRARFRWSDFFEVVQEVGAKALPIVGLISFLVGVILAFLGAIQLLQFGAQIFVADLVAIGMARDMAAMMVGIILAGRTGAAFAAQLGTMQVNEEIDALSTLGLSPMEFLVLPRMLALILMTPLLCIYANLLGILGGLFVGVVMLDLPAALYLQQTQASTPLLFFAGGLLKATVYGVVVAVCGCLRGMQCGRSAAAVGNATTSAVVTSIVFIILSMAALTVIYDALGI
jgi:phospholipid/cholesterol/gamma-HCH transport system permease protein